jgi:YD repeat-containing protein
VAYGDTHPGTEHETKFLEWLGTLDVESFHQSGAQPAWKAQSYVYDVGKRLRGLTDPEIGLHDWTYDINNRLRTMQYGGQTVNEIDYTVGGLVDRTRLKDASGATIAETEHVYDGLGRKIRQETRKAGSGELLAGFEWAYDELDLVEEVRVLHVGAKGVFKYNERRELTEEVWTATTGGNAPPFANVFVAAPPGALESVPSNEAEGQLSTGGSGFTPVVKEYDYDPAGNRRWMKVDGAQTDYVYDSGSRLTLETRPGGVQVEHDYDEWGNETLRTTTSGASPTVVEAYGYNHLNLLSSYVKTTGGAESANWQYDYWPTGERCA